MPEFIRVRDKDTKAKKSIPANSSLVGWDVLDEPATYEDGTPLPDKPHQPLSGQTAKSADTKKEN